MSKSLKFFAIINFFKCVFFNITSAEIDGLRVGNVLQADGRFTGFEAEGSVKLGSSIWANLGLGYVDARLTSTGEGLPRIPPMRGTFSLNIPSGNFNLRPELIFASTQDRIFENETETAGYTTMNVRATQVWPRPHLAHVLSVSAFNLTNVLYRSHTSFIKDLAPEMGRGIKVGYSVRFF